MPIAITAKGPQPLDDRAQVQVDALTGGSQDFFQLTDGEDGVQVDQWQDQASLDRLHALELALLHRRYLLQQSGNPCGNQGVELARQRAQHRARIIAIGLHREQGSCGLDDARYIGQASQPGRSR